jgi:hypothetical protein
MMVTLGPCIEIGGEKYEYIRKFTLKEGKQIPPDLMRDLKNYFKAEKVFTKRLDQETLEYYFVNEITTVEPIYETTAEDQHQP